MSIALIYRHLNFFLLMEHTSHIQGIRGLIKKEIQLNLCNILSIFIFNELYLFT